MAERVAVLLRAVNLGARNRISSAQLVDVVERAGGTDVSTYLQSGNAAATWTGTAAELEQAVTAALQDVLGWTVPVVVRTGPELARVVRDAPWTDLDPARFQVVFLAGEPDPAKVAAIDHEALLPERVVVGERVLYCDHAAGVQRSRLARLDLGVEATARNWRTTQALADLTA